MDTSQVCNLLSHSGSSVMRTSAPICLRSLNNHCGFMFKSTLHIANNINSLQYRFVSTLRTVTSYQLSMKSEFFSRQFPPALFPYLCKLLLVSSSQDHSIRAQENLICFIYTSAVCPTRMPFQPKSALNIQFRHS